ncbi:MAG: ATP-grasp domain-containing protein [Actinomycetes bacterium]
MNPRIALATAAEFPALDEDGAVLIAALESRGISAGPAVWTDPRVDWSSYDLVVVRCTWDYQERYDEFLAWVDRVAQATRLLNPASVLRWNTHKTYLRELASAGLPVISTAWLEAGDHFTVPDQGEYVVKPAVSAGSRDTNRYVVGEHDELAAAHATSLLAAGRTVMVQPYLEQVDQHGETALLFFGGDFSHAIRKGPLLERAMAPVEGAYKEETVEVRVPSEEERAVADAVLDALPSVSTLGGTGRRDLAYARVDLVPGDGGPILLELELTEPSMFLVHDGGDGSAAAGRFADVLAAQLP